jgi:hypothetical protein
MIYAYQDVSPGQEVGPVDVCIIGSGAGGRPARLTTASLDSFP